MSRNWLKVYNREIPVFPRTDSTLPCPLSPYLPLKHRLLLIQLLLHLVHLVLRLLLLALEGRNLRVKEGERVRESARARARGETVTMTTTFFSRHLIVSRSI